jgi:DNA-binding Lrp family transcriptional regulator
MATGFVLLTSVLGYDSQVEASLHDLNEVKDVYELYGMYDFIVKLESESIEDLKNVISKKIRRIGNIRSTLTLITTD